MLGTCDIRPTSKNKSGLVKVPVHFNVYLPKFLTKCPFGLVAGHYEQCHRQVFINQDVLYILNIDMHDFTCKRRE